MKNYFTISFLLFVSLSVNATNNPYQDNEEIYQYVSQYTHPWYSAPYNTTEHIKEFIFSSNSYEQTVTGGFKVEVQSC